MPVNFQGKVTVTTVITSLYDLMVAAGATNPPRKVAFLKLVGDDANTGAVYIGGSGVSSTDNSDTLLNGGDIKEIPALLGNHISTTTQYLKSATGSQTIHVEALLY